MECISRPLIYLLVIYTGAILRNGISIGRSTPKTKPAMYTEEMVVVDLVIPIVFVADAVVP